MQTKERRMTGNKRKITDLKVVELRVELEKRGLDTKGLKGVLVQRLQKAIEDDGGYGSEIEISGPETSSPKPSGRRVIGRTKRTQNDENTESSQDEEKSEMYACVETSEKPRDDVNEGDREQEESLAEQIIEEPADVFEKTPQSYSQDDFSHQDEEEGEVYQDAEESVDSKENMLIGCDELALEEAEGKSYDYRTHEEDSMDVPLEEEGGIPEDVVPDDWSKEMHSVENPEELEGSEEIVVEEVETAVVEKWDEAQVTIQADNFQVILEPIKLETKLPSQEKKKDSEMVVAGNEDDVLDMLDYDLEITGEQNNLNVNSEDVSKKAEKTTGEAKTTDKKTMEAKREVSDPPPEKKSRSTVDSQQKKSNPESKSAKSNSSKDGRKESTKKDTSPNRNLWISGLSSTTRASELKSAFSRYGKVIGAKVVTNVKSPGSRCYGYITMTSVEAAKKCILHLNNTDMHGRMITVEVAKGDPSASSKRQSSGSTSTSFTKKETDSKDHGKKETSDSKTNSTTRKSSSSTQPSTKADKGNSDNQGKVDSGKKTDSEQGGPAAEHRKSDDKDKTGKPKPKSPNRERQRDTTNSTSQRSGDKRHQNRSPGNSGSGARQRYNKDEPERKRMRQPNDDRKVVLDSHKGELRVNVSSVDGSRQGGRDERSAMGNVSRNIISRRRSFSPIRRRPETSPIRGQAPSRAGIRNARGGPFRNRTARGRGLISRHTAPGGRQAGFATSRAQRGRVQRERVRARLPLRLRERGGLVQPTHMERDRLRREREEREKLRLQREGLERERRQLEKDRQERERLEQERIRLEQERKRELEHIEREKAEMRRLQEITRYEVEQRQRAIKRTYDDDGPIGHRGSRSSNRDAYESKRSMMGSAGVRDMRDGRRAEREERRSYGGYNSREGRNGGRAAASPPPVSYRSSQNSFRNSGGGPGKITSRQIESRRQIPSDSHDTDARYVGVGPGPTALVRRSDDKYDRREQGRTIEYGHSSYDRESAADRHIESPVRRRGGQQRASALNHRDGRKVITRERTDQRGTSPDFRRASRGNISRIEITRVEQSPPLRRQRRGSSPPPTSVRVSSWREPKVASSRRDDDRDLREQLRGRQTSNMTGSYGDSSRDRERGSQRRAAVSAVSVSPVRSGVQYQSRWPSDSGDSGQIYSVNNSSNPIPTQTGRTGSTASWHSLSSSWQQGAATNGRTSWPGSAMPSATSVGRPIMPSTHTLVPSATTMVPVPPGTTILPTSANQAYLPTADRQSRSFQPYKTITRRY